MGAGRDHQVLLVLDGAGWHTSRRLRSPDGLHLLVLPACSPELQPAERLWPLLREAVANPPGSPPTTGGETLYGRSFRPSRVESGSSYARLLFGPLSSGTHLAPDADVQFSDDAQLVDLIFAQQVTVAGDTDGDGRVEVLAGDIGEWFGLFDLPANLGFRAARRTTRPGSPRARRPRSCGVDAGPAPGLWPAPRRGRLARGSGRRTSMSFWDHLPPSARASLQAVGQPRELAPGELLYERGKSRPDVHLVQAGALEVLDRTVRPAVVLAELGPGDVVGELGFLDGGVATADVRARGPARCLGWAGEALRAQLDADSTLGAVVWRAFAIDGASRTRAATADVLDGTRTVRGRGDLPPDVAALAAPLESALDAGDPVGLARVMVDTAAALERVAGRLERERIGRRLARHLQEPLAESSLLQAIAMRRPGGDGAWAVDRAFATAPPEGLDGALALLPTPRALRAAGEAVALYVHEARPETVLLLGARGDAVARALAQRTGAGGLVLVEDREDVVAGVRCALGAAADALEVVRQSPASVAAGLTEVALSPVDVVVLEGTLDVLPDRLARTLLARAARWVVRGGHVVLAATAPAADQGWWDHVGGWPLTRRTTAQIGEMVARAGLTVDPAPRAEGLAVARRSR